MPRPKLTDEHRRSVNFTVRLTDAEFKMLEALAAVCGKAPGVLIRDKVFKGRFPEPRSARLDRDVYFELKKIGVNLNQLARKANSNIMPTGLLALIFKLQRQQEVIIKLLFHDRQPENR